MDLSKVETLHRALSDTMLQVSEAQNMTPQEALAGVMRVFTHLLAAFVYDVAGNSQKTQSVIEGYCRDMRNAVIARLELVEHYEHGAGTLPLGEDDC